MKTLLVLFLFVMPVILFSQELKFSSNVGYTTGEMKALKKIMLSTGVNIGVELYIKHDLFFNTSAGFSLLRFDYSDTANNSVFNSKYFLNIPLSIKKYYTVSKKSWVFWDFGIFANYHFIDKKEIRNISGNNIKKQNDLGFNFGMLGSFGFKTIFSNNLSVDIGLSSQTDYISSYKNESDKIKTDKRMLVISLYRKLK